MSSPPLLDPGALLDGRYRLKTMLGEGGMGRVYEAEDLRLSRRVAIKVLRDEDRDESLGQRLFREAKAAARADHPAVITTYGYGTDPELGISYVVMEYLQGETVGQRIGRLGPLPVPFLVRVALDLADALIAIHGAGIVHRDLKPSNVFLASRGRRIDEVKLLDFGVAKLLDLHTLTATGQVYGTPMYMAPEQLSDSKHVDARCDLYALGAVLLECLTGKPPFDGPNIAALACQIALGPELDLRALRPELPSALIAVVTRCMKKRARDRFPDARALYDALNGIHLS